MQIQRFWFSEENVRPSRTSEGSEDPGGLRGLDSDSTLVLLFADSSFSSECGVWNRLREIFPHSILLGCSTAGNIAGQEISDGCGEGIAIRFERTELRLAVTSIKKSSESLEAGMRLAQQFPPEDLRAVFLLSEGLAVNGTDLVKGLVSMLPPDVGISGGLAADGSRFEQTWILAGEAIGPRMVGAVAFYGQHFRSGYGSAGGWDKFGVERRVTRSEGTVLYELDGQPALKLYKEYLGAQSAALPASGLLFPLSMRVEGSTESVVRTILQVNEEEQSLTFAGEIPINARAQLMKANLDRLVGGATEAAEQAGQARSGAPQASTSEDELSGSSIASLAIAVSCVGRRLVLKGRAEEELEATTMALPPGAEQVGFYSYGELAPRSAGSPCSLHNQTMTVTLFHE